MVRPQIQRYDTIWIGLGVFSGLHLSSGKTKRSWPVGLQQGLIGVFFSFRWHESYVSSASTCRTTHWCSSSLQMSQMEVMNEQYKIFIYSRTILPCKFRNWKIFCNMSCTVYCRYAPILKIIWVKQRFVMPLRNTQKSSKR